MTNVQTPTRRPSRARRAVNAIIVIVSVMVIVGAAIGAVYISQTQDTTTATPTDDGSYGIPPYGADQSAIAVDEYNLGNVPAYITDALRDCPGNGARKENGDLDIAKQRPCLHGMPVFGLKDGNVQTLIAYNNTTLTMLSDVSSARTYDFSVGDHLVFAAVVREQTGKNTWSTWTYLPEFGEATFRDGTSYQLTLALRNPNEATTTTPLGLPAAYDYDWATVMPQMLHN